MSRRVTIKDVAKAAGVSAPVVSSVINSAKKCTARVSPETRERVERVAREIGYRRSNAAVALRTNRTSTIAILGGFHQEIGWLYSGSNMDIMIGVNQELVRDGRYGLIVDLERSRKSKGYLSLDGGRIDGAIVVEYLDDHLRESLKQAGIPYVMVNIEPLAKGTVFPDALKPLEAIIPRWQTEGVKKIAYIQPRWISEHYSTKNRGPRIESLCGKCGIEFVTQYLDQETPPLETAIQMQEQNIDGVISYSESMMQRMCSTYLCNTGSLPFEHLLTWGRESVDHYLIPAIERISISFTQLGAVAARKLISRIESPSVEINSELVPCEYMPSVKDANEWSTS